MTKMNRLYKTVDFKKLVSDLFHADYAVEERKSMKIKITNITIASKPFHMQYRSTQLQCISLTLHCKYLAETLWDQCKLVSDEVKNTNEYTKQ